MTKPPSISSTPDQELLLKVSIKDEEAFKELYARYNVAVFNYLLRLIHHTTFSEDLLQETFLAIWQGAQSFRGKSSVKTWMFRIAHHKAVSWLRKHSKKQEIQYNIDDVALFSQEHSPEETAIQSGQITQIQSAIEQLSQNHRSTIELTFVHGFSYKEIAKIMGCPVGTVKSRMNYALKYLSADLTREDNHL